ncbi:hypothetical protein [Rhodoluna limnophila]|uniref:hypothetical protein n=1 Tax=Rhodoluna limnophila TaxID=232537 RepID=UPI001106F0CA|nr:hypothetical protein [Rhodoluna limnophila]
MTKVHIVCGAGASSTFLAVKLRAISQNQDLGIQFFPTSLEGLQAKAGDIVLVASHIVGAPSLGALHEAGITVVSLPEKVNGGFNAEDAIELITQHLQ